MPDCHAMCPMTCGENEQLCPGEYDSITGCTQPDTCAPSSYPSSVATMPDCTAMCPMTCGENEQLCPGEFDSVTGCSNGDFCMPAGAPCS